MYPISPHATGQHLNAVYAPAASVFPDIDWTPDGGDTFAWADPVPYDYSSNQRPWTLDSLTDDELTILGLA